MSHCSPNHPAFCLVCDRQINYGDEMPSCFCSEICEREAEDHWEFCDLCSDLVKKEGMVKLVSGFTACPVCFDKLPEGNGDDRDQT